MCSLPCGIGQSLGFLLRHLLVPIFTMARGSHSLKRGWLPRGAAVPALAHPPHVLNVVLSVLTVTDHVPLQRPVTFVEPFLLYPTRPSLSLPEGGYCPLPAPRDAQAV